MLQTPRVLVKEEVAAYERLVDLLQQKSNSNMSLQSSSSSFSAASEMEEKNIQEKEEEEAEEEEARHERAEEERKNQEEEVEERYKEKGEEEEKCREAEADTEEKLEKESKEEVEHGREEQKDGGTEERQQKEEEAEERKEEGNDEDREERKEAGIEKQEEVERGEGEEDIEDERKQENHHREGIEREEDEEKKKKLVSSKDVEKEKGKEKNGHTEELEPEQKNGRAFSSTVIVEEVPAAEGAAATVEDRAITASNDRATAHITGAAFAAAEETETLCTAAGVCTFTAGSCEGDGHENSAASATSDSAPAAVAARRVVAASSASIATVPERARIYTAPDHVSEGAPEGAAAAEKETEDEEVERLEQTLEQNKAIPAEDDVLYRGGQTSVETGAVRQAVLSAAAPTGQETRVNLKPVAATTTPRAKSLQTPATEAAGGGATTGIVSPGVAVAAAADAAADGAPSFEEAAEAAAAEAAAAEAAAAEAAVAEAAAAEAAAAEAAVAEAAVAAAEVVAAEAAAVGGAAAVGQATTIGGVAAEAAPAGAVSAERVAAAGEAVVAAAAIGKLAQSGEREERRCTPYTMAVAAGASEPAAAVLGTTAPDCVAVIVNKAAIAPSRALSMLNAERTFGMGKFENKEEQERKERERQICMGAVACDEAEICRYLTHESSSSRSSGVVLKNMMVPKSSGPACSPREQHMQHGKELELYTEDEMKEERKQEAEQQQSMQLLEQQSLQERIRGEEKREIQEEGKKQRDPQHVEAEMHASCTEVQDERYQQQRQAVTGAITTDKEEQQVKKTQEQEQQPSTRELQHRILAHPLELQQHHLREQQCFTEKQHEHYQNAKKEEEEYAGDVQKEGCREEHVEQGVRYGLSSPAATAAAVDTVSASKDGAAAESALPQKKETDTLTANTDEMDYQDIDELDGAATKIEEWTALKEKLEAELLQQQHLLQEVQETLEEEAQRARKDAWGRSNIQGILDGVMTGSSSRPPVQAPLDILRAEAQRLKQAMDATSRKAESVRKRRFYLEEQQIRQQQCKQQEQQQQQLLSILRLTETDSKEEEQEKSSNQQPHQQQEEHEQSAGEPQYRTSHDCIPKAHLAECYQSQNKDELSSTYDPAKQEAVGKHTLFADSGASDSSASIKRGAVPISQPSIDRPCAGLFAGLQFKKRGFAGPIDKNTVASLNISSHTAVVTSSRSSQPDMSSATNLRQAPPAARASHAPTIKHDTAGDGCGDIRGTKAATAEKEIFSVRSCPSNEITLPCAVPVADSTASAESRRGPFDIPASATAPHHVVLENSD